MWKPEPDEEEVNEQKKIQKQFFDTGMLVGLRAVLDMVKSGISIEIMEQGYAGRLEALKRDYGDSEVITFIPLMVEDSIEELKRGLENNEQG